MTTPINSSTEESMTFPLPDPLVVAVDLEAQAALDNAWDGHGRADQIDNLKRTARLAAQVIRRQVEQSAEHDREVARRARLEGLQDAMHVANSVMVPGGDDFDQAANARVRLILSRLATRVESASRPGSGDVLGGRFVLGELVAVDGVRVDEPAPPRAQGRPESESGVGL